MEIKTLTVNGQTFTVADPDALHREDITALVSTTPQQFTAAEKAQARKNIGVVYGSDDPSNRRTAENLAAAYEVAFYSSLSAAAADINAATTVSADAAAETASLAVYKNQDGNTCVTLLRDIELTETVIFSQDVTVILNGYTVNYRGDFALRFNAGYGVVDGRVAGSSLCKELTEVPTAVCLVEYRGSNGAVLGAHLQVQAESGTTAIGGILVYPGSEVRVENCTIDAQVRSGECVAYGIVNMGKITLLDSVLTVVSDQWYGCCIECQGTSTQTVQRCRLSAVAKVERAYAAEIKSGAVVHAADSEFTGASEAYTARGWNIAAGAVCHAAGCSFTGDGTTGSVVDTGYGAAQGIYNGGTLTLEKCTVYGTQTGLHAGEGSVTTIIGGIFEGPGHGGVYIACDGDGKFYAKNATFRSVHYRGRYMDTFHYANNQYMRAAVYVGGGSNIKAYMHNCILDGSGPAMEPDGEEYIGAEPIRLRNASNEKNNAVYLSCCTLQGDGKIRFGNSSHKIYLGHANRLLCEANLPYCIDSTSYAGTIFTGWEE